MVRELTNHHTTELSVLHVRPGHENTQRNFEDAHTQTFAKQPTFQTPVTFKQVKEYYKRCKNKPDISTRSLLSCWKYWYMYQGRKEMFYLTTHSTHFIYGYMASDIC